ncbi:glycosyltransferase family 2 protein [Alkalicoccus luteus]|uniref:Glycosyltransferase n=1 Tax=Alkalicoccus luteus TaxID=1237094 RepID=A0A969PVP8_9BACI|nr:glycosyltransferase [Alkalicoccus luteus]NJP38778.1 glycosyltransferase [Alkalicoccus luteus]
MASHQQENTGIKNANGTYVSFIDCDDWYHPEMLEALYQAARSEKADMVLCNYQEVIDGEPAVHFTSWPAPVLIEKEDALEKLFDDKHTFIVPWNRLYHKSLFSRVTYPERKHYDDEFTAHSFINEAEKIVHIDHDFYFYRIRSSSETRTSMSAKKFDKIEAVSNRLIYLKPHKKLYQKGLVHFHHLFFWYYNQSKGMVEPSVRIRGKACFKKHFIQLLMTNQLTVKEKAASALFYVSDNWYEKLITNKRE